MSSSRQFCDGKAAEKSNFVQTCNLLSKYIKEKGNLRDLNIEIGGKIESLEAIVKPGSSYSASASTTMDIMRNKGKSAQPSTEQQPSMAPNSSINTAEDASCKPTRSDDEDEEFSFWTSKSEIYSTQHKGASGSLHQAIY